MFMWKAGSERGKGNGEGKRKGGERDGEKLKDITSAEFLCVLVCVCVKV